MNYIKRFYQIINMYSDIPKPFIIAGAVSIISTCFGRFFNIKDSRDKRPNLFIILAGAPAITRRSELVKYVNIVRNTALKKYCELTETNIENELKSHVLEGGSSEGLIDQIEQLKGDGADCFLLNSSEFGRILDGIKNVTYMAMFQSTLIKLWSGESDYQTFSKRSDTPVRYLSPGTYFNIFAVMQKPKHYLDKKMSNTGLVRRLLIFNVEGDDLEKWNPPLMDNHDECNRKLKQLGEEIGKKMYEYSKAVKDDYIKLKYDDDVKKKINELAKKNEMMAREDDENPYYLFLVTRWEYYLKVATCFALDNNSDIINLKHLKKAIIFVNVSTKTIRDTLQDCLIPPNKKREEEFIQKIKRKVNKKKKIPKREIQQFLGSYKIRKDEFAKLLKRCTEENIIKVHKEGKTIYLIPANQNEK